MRRCKRRFYESRQCQCHCPLKTENAAINNKGFRGLFVGAKVGTSSLKSLMQAISRKRVNWVCVSLWSLKRYNETNETWSVADASIIISTDYGLRRAPSNIGSSSTRHDRGKLDCDRGLAMKCTSTPSRTQFIQHRPVCLYVYWRRGIRVSSTH